MEYTNEMGQDPELVELIKRLEVTSPYSVIDPAFKQKLLEKLLALQAHNSNTTTAPVESELAGMFLTEALEQGKEIEIPSLGIKIKNEPVERDETQ